MRPPGHPLYNRGETAPVLFAPFATRHMHELGTTPEMLAAVAVKNHHNGCLDPYAHFQSEITVDQVLASPSVCHPLRLLDCCPQTDGAAALILTTPERARDLTDKPVFVSGFGARDRPSRRSTRSRPSSVFPPPPWPRAAPSRWRISGPADMDMAEVHDCFTITEILDIEDIGFVEKGKGGPATVEGQTALDGRIPVNPSGGLLAKGHPIGATGVAQICECYWQLREEAGDRQVAIRHGHALQHNVGGRGSGVVGREHPEPRSPVLMPAAETQWRGSSRLTPAEMGLSLRQLLGIKSVPANSASGQARNHRRSPVVFSEAAYDRRFACR